MLKTIFHSINKNPNWLLTTLQQGSAAGPWSACHRMVFWRRPDSAVGLARTCVSQGSTRGCSLQRSLPLKAQGGKSQGPREQTTTQMPRLECQLHGHIKKQEAQVTWCLFNRLVGEKNAFVFARTTGTHRRGRETPLDTGFEMCVT